MFGSMCLTAREQCSRYSYLLLAGRLCGRIAVGDGEISFSVWTDPGTDPAASTVSKGAFTLGVKAPWCVGQTSHPHVELRLCMNIAVLLNSYYVSHGLL
jgi:hypothetical protein